MKKTSYWLGGIVLCLLAQPAQAQFSMSDVIIDIGDGSPRQRDIELLSESKETQYIATETYVIEHPSGPSEKRTRVTDPQKSGLLITPNKMVLPANARKLMRFLILKPQTDQDQIYRVTVKPVVQGVEAQDQRIALKLLVGYDALVIIRPKDAKVQLEGERKGNSLTLVNKGNTNANIVSGQQCNATGGDCKDINVTRIYAGQSWTTTLPNMEGPVKLEVWDGTKSQDVTF